MNTRAHTRTLRHLSLPLAATALTLFFGRPLALAVDAAATLPPGIVDFAGCIARNHWSLFGSEKRDELETLNRELRISQQRLDRPRTTEEARRAALDRGTAAADRLLDLVKTSPQLVRVDLAATPPALKLNRPIELPGDSGVFLFEVARGGEGVSYVTSVFDLSQSGGESTLMKLDVATNGTTYVVVDLEHLPFGRTLLGVRFRPAGQSSFYFPLDVTTPPPGRLKLTVLSDDTGKPAPAMVRLMSYADGLARQPGNGIEFAAQFDNEGTASGARNANLPGALKETFWCVPGPLDMALPAGKWQIGVRRGAEHEAIFRDITVRPGETVTQTLRPKRWVDMCKRGWWSGDDHVHCRLLSDEDAQRLMSWVKAEDIHLANVVKMGNINRTFFEQRGFGPNYRVVDGETVLVPGQECPRTHEEIGHTLAMNITDMVRDTERYFLYDEVFDSVHAQGGLTGYAHVNSGAFNVHRDMTMNVPRQKVDFAEILQFNTLGTDLYYEFLNLGCKLTASSGSDVPWGGTIGEVRAYACLGKKPFSADAWFEAFRQGHTFTTSGPMLEFRVDNALPGDELRLKSDRKLRIRARAWGDPKRMAPMELEIVRHGEVIRTAKSAHTNQAAVDLDFTVDGGYGCWLAARARAGDGTSAHTTPVYVVREGLRFWKFGGLKELLDKRESSLAEIEKIVAEARRDNAEGKLEQDRSRKQLALQGDLLLQRVGLARKLYQDLRRVEETERAARGLSGR
jgi:hypothetical protein